MTNKTEIKSRFLRKNGKKTKSKRKAKRGRKKGSDHILP